MGIGRRVKGKSVSDVVLRFSAFSALEGYMVLADRNYCKALISVKDRALFIFACYQNENPIIDNVLIPSSAKCRKTD